MAKKNGITAEEWMAKYNKSAEECIDHLVERNAKIAKNKRFYNKSAENKEKFYDMCVKGIVSMFGEDYREYAIKSLDKFFEDAAANKAAIRKEAAKKAAATRAYRKGMTAEQVEADKAESKMSYLDYLAKCAETTADVAEVAEVETPTTTPTTEYVDELNPNGMQPLFTPERIEHLKETLPTELGVSSEEIDAALEILTIPQRYEESADKDADTTIESNDNNNNTNPNPTEMEKNIQLTIETTKSAIEHLLKLYANEPEFITYLSNHGLEAVKAFRDVNNEVWDTLLDVCKLNLWTAGIIYDCAFNLETESLLYIAKVRENYLREIGRWD